VTGSSARARRSGVAAPVAADAPRLASCGTTGGAPVATSASTSAVTGVGAVGIGAVEVVAASVAPGTAKPGPDAGGTAAASEESPVGAVLGAVVGVVVVDAVGSVGAASGAGDVGAACATTGASANATAIEAVAIVHRRSRSRPVGPDAAVARRIIGTLGRSMAATVPVVRDRASR
jgi:hypothetical protein